MITLIVVLIIKILTGPPSLICFIVYKLSFYRLNFIDTSQLQCVGHSLMLSILEVENWKLRLSKGEYFFTYVDVGRAVPIKWGLISDTYFFCCCTKLNVVFKCHSFLRFIYVFTGYEENILSIYKEVYNNGRVCNSIIIRNITVCMNCFLRQHITTQF